MIEFEEFPKMARLSRECIISEKIDGTNAQVCITEEGEFLTGSRNRWIIPGDDNAGFAKWAYANKEELMILGEGWHRGEWWGQGIQRGYGLKEKRFSLFNTIRWCLHGNTPQSTNSSGGLQEILPKCVGLVPILYRGVFTTEAVDEALSNLEKSGSLASPEFMKPEGIVVYHMAGAVGFKRTIEKDDIPKTLQK